MVIMVLGLGVRATGVMVDGVIMVLAGQVLGGTVEGVITVLGGTGGIADSVSFSQPIPFSAHSVRKK
jgi:hypothetical protein